MMPTQTVDASGMLLLLVTAAVRTLALAAVARLVLAVFRVKATSARLLTWTAVLYAALALPLLLWLLPSIQVPLPILPQTGVLPAPSAIATANVTHPAVNRQPEKQTLVGRGKLSPEFVAGIPVVAGHKPAMKSTVWTRSLSWTSAATTIYLAVALILLLRFLIGLAVTQRLVKTSQQLTDERLRSILSSRAQWSDSSLPRVCESLAIAVPITVGPIRSTILLPSNWHEWDDERLEAVMTHELSHVSRHDPLTHCIALLYRAIFWFSPLAWWLHAHIAELAEQASDEAALSSGADRNHYARTLLGFFETLHAAPQRVWWQGVSMAHAGQAEKRLEKILGWKGSVAMHLKKSAIILITTLAIPVVYLAASVRPTTSSPASVAAQQPPQPAAAAVPAQPAPPPTGGVNAVAPIAGVPGHGPIAGVPAPPVPPLRGVAAVPAMSAPPAPAQTSSFATGHNHGSWYSYGFDDDERFVIVTGKSDSFNMSGSSQDAHHVEKLRKQISGDFIWFQRDEKSYIIRDQATIDRAHKLWAPQEELGKKQEELGRQQEVLGKQQEELGAKMEQVKVNVPDMTAAIDRLKAKLQKLGPTATMEQVGELQSEIGELQSKIGELQSHAGDQQGKLGEEMGALGEKQGKLGEQQGELGRQQGELAEKAAKEMKQILDEAIKNGKAQPEPEMGETGSL